jgi:hypothetical protein
MDGWSVVQKRESGWEGERERERVRACMRKSENVRKPQETASRLENESVRIFLHFFRFVRRVHQSVIIRGVRCETKMLEFDGTKMRIEARLRRF